MRFWPVTLRMVAEALNSRVSRLLIETGSKIFPILVAIGVGIAVGALIGASAEYGSQVYPNLADCDMGFWSAVYYKNLNLKLKSSVSKSIIVQPGRVSDSLPKHLALVVAI